MNKQFKYFSTESDFLLVFMKAHSAGCRAMKEFKPTPVSFVCCDLNDKPLPGVEEEVVEEGECGLAWIKIYPATPKMKGLENSFSWWVLKKEMGKFEEYTKSVNVYPPDNNQYIGRKEAYCDAFVKVLEENEIRAFVGTYLT
jgi:hypothetical protein